MPVQVGPQAIYVVGRDDDVDSVAGGSEVSDAASWETIEDTEMENLQITLEVYLYSSVYNAVDVIYQLFSSWKHEAYLLLYQLCWHMLCLGSCLFFSVSFRWIGLAKMLAANFKG